MRRTTHEEGAAPVDNGGMSIPTAPAFPFPEFRRDDVVSLISPHGNASAGACGRIVGRYARDADPTYVVRFEDQVCNDVRPDELVPANAI